MRKFFKTVAIVTVFSVCEKCLGFIYRIFLSRTIGSEGIGMYQVALSLFGLLWTITCSGIPVTVSRLMTKFRAENQNDKIEKTITAGIVLTLIVAIPITIIAFLVRNNLSFIFANQKCLNVFLVILPGLIFTSVYAVMRGVFWGNKDFLPYSIIELLEEAVMIISGVILISFAHDVYEGAFMAGLAVFISFVFSFTLSICVFFLRKNRFKNPKGLIKPLLKSSTPITMMRTSGSLVTSLIAILLPLRLVASGYSSSEAMSVFGSAIGQTVPLLFIPTTLVGSFTLVLIPEIAENFYSKKYDYLKNDIEKSLKFTVFLTCLFVPPFTILGKEFGIIIFNSPDCGKYLSVSAFLTIFISVSNLTTSILNSIGLEQKTLICFIIVAMLMLLSVIILPLFIGIYSLLIGYAFVSIITSIYNIVLINKHCPKKTKCTKFLLFSILMQFPSIILGAILKKMLLNILGTFFTLVIISIILVIFNALLFIGFNLISLKEIKGKLKLNFKNKKQPDFNI